MTPSLTVGSRDSALALTQTKQVMDALAAHYPDLSMPLKTYKTQGDLVLETALAQIGDKGLFVKELEVALMNGEIDFAVHSMKDMPSEQPEGLQVFPFGEREIPLDALISKSGQSFWELPAGAVVGTSSLRRQALLKKSRPDLLYQNVRGNLQTRLRKLDEGPYDALVLAVAGLHRMQLAERITHTFSTDMMIPACCQGTLAIEIKDERLLNTFQPFVYHAVRVCTLAERAFLRTMQGGCQIPMAAYARNVAENRYHIVGLVSDVDGERVFTAEQTFSEEDAEPAGQEVAERILVQGGREILDALWHASRSS